MYCYQCEQAAKGTGCTSVGVCGKDADTAALQDLVIYGLKSFSNYAHRTRKTGMKDSETDVFAVEALFPTLTNVNFDPARLAAILSKLGEMKTRAKAAYEEACKTAGQTPEQLNGFSSRGSRPAA